jgi:hypothetical protein
VLSDVVATSGCAGPTAIAAAIADMHVDADADPIAARARETRRSRPRVVASGAAATSRS